MPGSKTNDNQRSPDDRCAPRTSSIEKGPVLLCPLRFEYEIVRRAAAGSNVACFCTGPANAGLRPFLESFAASRAIEADAASPGGIPPIILVGLAGSLSAKRAVGSAWVARHIVSEQGRSWPTTWPTTANPHAVGLTMVTILGAEGILTSPQAKSEAHHEHAAELVDTESHLLAEWATRHDIPWGVVRGVSDGYDDSLPDTIEGWTRPDGRPNLVRIGLDLAAHPGWIGGTRRLARSSRSALGAVIAILRRLGVFEPIDRNQAPADE